MQADSERDAEAIRSEMRKKHKAIFSPRGLAALEQARRPAMRSALPTATRFC